MTIVQDITQDLILHMEFSDHLKVFSVQDKESGLDARIFVHSVINGTALGGCRRWAYRTNDEWNADGLRLSRGMTKKAAVAGLPLGGAKAAINHEAPTACMMRAFGKGIDMIEKEYGITYITAEDVGITEELLKSVKIETDNVRGIAPKGKGDLAGGDPGPFTAYGVYAGIKVAVKHKMDRDDLSGVTVAVQGLGGVGHHLCRFLHEEGARLFVTDLDVNRMQQAMDEFGAVPIKPDEILSIPVDVFAPCAMGGILDGVAEAKIIAGSANNQQKDEIKNTESKKLAQKNVLYAPDYVINAGGLISVYYEGEKTSDIMDMIYNQVSKTLDRIFVLSDHNEKDTATIADELSLQMLSEKSSLSGKRVMAKAA